MKKQIQVFIAVAAVLALVLLAGTVHAGRNYGGGPPPKPKITPPTLIEDVDAASHTIKIVSGEKRAVTTYTITPFTTIKINDKPGKVEDLKKGMKVSVSGKDGGNANRIEAYEMAGGDAPAEGEKKKK
jgi:hypothetical protein